MNVKTIMRIIYISIIIGVILLFTGIIVDKSNYEHIIEKVHIFDIANLFLQIGIVLTAIVLILHANHIVDTINLH
jgi:hypothetical protein